MRVDGGLGRIQSATSATAVATVTLANTITLFASLELSKL
jgi:hypothetical protein